MVSVAQLWVLKQLNPETPQLSESFHQCAQCLPKVALHS